MYIIKNSIVYLLSIFLAIILYKYISKKKLKFARTKTICITIIFLFVVFFSLNTFVSFSTPEEAYRFNYEGKIEFIVEGQETALVIAYDNSDKRTAIVTKSAEKWKAGAGYQTKTVSQLFKDDIGMVVLNYNNSKDYYVLISCLNDRIYSVEDSMNSSFTFSDDGRSCCAVIEDYDELYSVIVNRQSGDTVLGNNV